MPASGKKKKKKIKDINWADDEHFLKERSIVYIEHTYECPIFQTKAEEFGQWLQEQVPERIIQLVRNKNGKVEPREGAFEIDFSQNARTSVHNIWSGLERGPPRRDKFPPDYNELFPDIQKVLKKFYPDKITNPEDEFSDDYDMSTEPMQ